MGITAKDALGNQDLGFGGSVGLAVLEHLRALDEVAYLRFASVYKGFADIGDFEREVGLLTKSTDPKQSY